MSNALNIDLYPIFICADSVEYLLLYENISKPVNMTDVLRYIYF